MDLYSKIKSLQKDVVLPAKENLRDLLLRVNKVLETEDSLFDSLNYRPQNKRKAPGGLLDFQDNITTIIVPDLHARVDFIPSLLDFKTEVSRLFAPTIPVSSSVVKTASIGGWA